MTGRIRGWVGLEVGEARHLVRFLTIGSDKCVSLPPLYVLQRLIIYNLQLCRHTSTILITVENFSFSPHPRHFPPSSSSFSLRPVFPIIPHSATFKPLPPNHYLNLFRVFFSGWWGWCVWFASVWVREVALCIKRTFHLNNWRLDLV